MNSRLDRTLILTANFLLSFAFQAFSADWIDETNLNTLKTHLGDLKLSGTPNDAKPTQIFVLPGADPERSASKTTPEPSEIPTFLPGRIYNFGASCPSDNQDTFEACIRFEVVNTPNHEHGGTPPQARIHPATPVCQTATAPGSIDGWVVALPNIGADMRAHWTYSGACTTPPRPFREFRVRHDLFPIFQTDGISLGPKHNTHSNSHYAQLNVRAKLTQIGAAYKKKFPQLPLLEIRVASLEWGGLFDVNSDWSPPFAHHDEGWQVWIGGPNGSTLPFDVVGWFLDISDIYEFSVNHARRLGLVWLNFGPDRDNQVPSKAEEVLDFIAEEEKP